MAIHTITIIQLLLSVLLLFQISTPVDALSKHPILIIISYDGFRYDYLEKTSTPNLDKVKKDGVWAPYMEPQFLTYSFPNHHSISTGLYIESHGVVTSSIYDPELGLVLSGVNDSPGFWNYSSSVLPLWVVNEDAGDERHSGCMMWMACSQPFGPNNTTPTYFRPSNRLYTYEQRVDDVISWIMNEEKPANLVFVHFDQPDSAGHTYGPEGPEVITQIERMDNLTGYFLDELDRLNLTEKVNLMFLSDHGMEEIKSSRVVNFTGILDNTNNTLFNSYGPPSPAFRMLLPKQENETLMIYNALHTAAATANFSVFLKSELKQVKPNWHVDSRRFLPILVMLDPGYVFDDWNFSASRPDEPAGAHGYDSNHPNMRPYFMAIGPIFKGNGTQVEPFNNTDIYPLVCRIMGMEAPPNNGTIEAIIDLLRETESDDSGVGGFPRISATLFLCLFICLFINQQIF